ncbi:murein hydrolase activator EnvC family protein [Amphritea balenae]|uniref:Peptidase M23 n=1 Tax=Amphritea balenae TaxID=452629 RepID=A0A3P1SKQ3_9GAMM|nr:peptidoglycan DD-metalloendopeptidase family protein [Amphritea balenae]RRC97524.1 peptidase M23 [Amphritea balenae]GGK74372.1 non-catalytic member of peptidase subfamily M23B [Amphritea balenae]
MLRKLLLVLLTIGLISPTATVIAAQEKATTGQINELKKNIRELAQTLGEIKGERKSVQKELRRTDKMIGELAGELLRLNSQLKGAEKRLSGLEKQRKPLLTSLQKQAVKLETQLRQQYKTGSQPRLQLLLTQRDPEQVSRMLSYYDRINQTLSLSLKSFRNDLAKLDQTEQDIRSSQQDIFDRRDLMRARSQDLEGVRQERKKVLVAIEGQLKSGSQQLKTMQANQKRLESLLTQIRTSIEKIAIGGDERSFRELKGRLVWPVKGKITRGFGNIRDGIGYEGILVAGRSGRSVKAVHHGRVVFSDWLRGYGLLTIVDHGGGYMSLYGHNETLLTDVGEWVSAGDQVATIGSSGGSTKPGLYFAIRYKGKASDPVKWLARR